MHYFYLAFVGGITSKDNAFYPITGEGYGITSEAIGLHGIQMLLNLYVNLNSLYYRYLHIQEVKNDSILNDVC